MFNPRRVRQLKLQVWAKAHALDPSVASPEDWPQRFRLDPAGSWALSAGDCAPGFVGLYTVVNALDLLLANSKPLEPAEKKWLLDIGWRFLSDRNPIRLWSSVRLGTMVRMTDALCFALARRRSRFIGCHEIRLATIKLRPLNIERFIVSRQSVIILLGDGQYSVLRGYTPESWLLFDCNGRSWIKRRASDTAERMQPRNRQTQTAIVALSSD